MISNHIVICGLGTAGRSVAGAFRDRGLRPRDISVIEADHERSEMARRLGHRTIAGDAADPARLRVAQGGAAGAVIVCVGDGNSAAVVRAARRLAPSVRIGAVLRHGVERRSLVSSGADEVVVLSSLAGGMLAASVLG